MAFLRVKLTGCIDFRGKHSTPPQDMRHFKAMLRKVDNTFVKDLTLKPEDMEALQSGTWHGKPPSCLPAHSTCEAGHSRLNVNAITPSLADYEKAIAHAQVSVHVTSARLTSICKEAPAAHLLAMLHPAYRICPPQQSNLGMQAHA